MSVELISVLIAVLAIGSSAVRANPDQQSRTAGGHGPDGDAAARRHEAASALSGKFTPLLRGVFSPTALLRYLEILPALLRRAPH